MLRKYFGNKTEQILRRFASFLTHHSISPNQLTLTGLAVNAFAGLCYFKGWFVFAGSVMILGGFFDILDGAVARVAGKSTRIGAYTDAVIDRYSDCFIFGGLLLHFAKKGDMLYCILLLTILCGTFLVSYIRARAELVIQKCDVGFMERTERIVLLAAGSIFNFLFVALWILAVGTHLTALHRIWYTFGKREQL